MSRTSVPRQLRNDYHMINEALAKYPELDGAYKQLQELKQSGTLTTEQDIASAAPLSFMPSSLHSSIAASFQKVR